MLLTWLRRSVARRRETPAWEEGEDDLGEEGLERNLGVEGLLVLGVALLVVLHWSLGLVGRDGVAAAVEATERHPFPPPPPRDRRRGVDGFEKKPNFDRSLGVGIGGSV